MECVYERYIIHLVHVRDINLDVFMFQSKCSDQIVHFSIEMQRK